MIHPIDNIKWVEPKTLKANDYNPNVVISQEMRLLEFSLKKQGWIQPILVTHRGVIIDGFHRWSIASRNDWKVPVAVLELSEPERMLLTIRINRAKGSHVAFNMAEIVKRLVNEYSYSIKTVMEEIGASREEIDLLLQEDVFEKMDIANHSYSKAWVPK